MCYLFQKNHDKYGSGLIELKKFLIHACKYVYALKITKMWQVIFLLTKFNLLCQHIKKHYL